MNFLRSIFSKPLSPQVEESDYTRSANSTIPVSETNGREHERLSESERQSEFPGDDASPGMGEEEQQFYGTYVQEQYSPDRIREALTILQESNPTFPGLSALLDKHGYRMQNSSIRDLSPRARLGILRKAEILSVANPLATRALQIRTDLIVSEGFRLVPDLDMPTETETQKKAKEEAEKECQVILDEYWKFNSWEDCTFPRVYDLGVTGEMIRRLPLIDKVLKSGETFNPGRFKCGAVIPYYIDQAILEPWDYEQVDYLVLQPIYFETLNVGKTLREEDRILKVCREVWEGDEIPGTVDGDVFYTSVNRRVGSTRGISDLTPAIEYLELHDQTLYSDCERANLMMRFIWDITLQDASPKTIKEYAKELGNKVVKPGAHRIHNQKETWQAISPDLNIPQTRELREDIFLYSWGALGLPRQWYVDAENVNRSNDENMTSPVFKWARTRRDLVGSHLRLESLKYLQIAHNIQRITKCPYNKLGVKVVSRDPDRRSYDTVGTALKDIADALTVAKTSGFLDQKNCASIFQMVAGSMGIEIDQKSVDEAEDPMEAVTREADEALKKNQSKYKNRIGGLDDGEKVDEEPGGESASKATDRGGNRKAQ